MSNPNSESTHYHHFNSGGTNSSINLLPVTESSGKLKVEDALKYIDKVKSRFKEDVYKKFLEVMKDFKAQKINTESVIQNVLTLFNGHQDLIEGFNTFLPHGYQMCNYQVQNTPNFVGTGLTGLHNALGASQPVISTQPYTILPGSIKYGETQINNNIEPVNYINKEKSDLNNIQHVQSGNNSINIKSSSPAMNQGPTEFSHAVEYVNKIKNRFQKQPDVYKRFLEILHWYQKEQKNPDSAKRKKTEAEVSQEVAKLFDNEQDLLDEFSTFLPESADEMCQNRKSVSANFKPLPGVNQSYFINASNSAALAGSGNISERAKFSFQNKMDPASDSNDKETPEFYRSASMSSSSNTPLSNKRNLVQETSTNDRRLQNSGHPPTKRIRTNSSSTSVKETSRNNILNNPELKYSRYFEYISAMCQELLNLPSEKPYNSFINTLKLFNEEIISIDELRNLVKPLFSKKSEPWLNFLKILDKLNQQEKQCSADQANHSNHTFESRLIANGSNFNHVVDSVLNERNLNQNSTGSNAYLSNVSLTKSGTGSAVFCRRNIELSKLELCGSHYRILPEELTEPHSVVQSKNKLCKEVLNYNFLCHRSLSAEDAPFVFSKKNSSEESVFKIEDERYEIDMVMEVNKAAMVRLADLLIRLKEMTPETLKDFNFEDGLYKSSSIVFYKAIQRIYGEKSAEIISGLRNYPSTVVPIVLNRLQEKNAEWKEKIKQFQKHWRDQDQCLIKSLDHQALNFRTRDATNTRPKSLLGGLDSKAKMKPLFLTNFQDRSSFSKLINSLLTIRRTWKFEKPEKWGTFAFQTSLNHGGTSSSTPSMITTNAGPVVELSNRLDPMPDYHLLLLFPCDVEYTKSILDEPFQKKRYLFSHMNWFQLLADASSLVIHHLKRQSNFSKEDKTHMKNLMRQLLQDFFIDERFAISDDEEDSNSDNNIETQPPVISSPQNTAESQQSYKLILGSKSWYVFLRLYHVLIDRLSALKIKAEQIVSQNNEKQKQNTHEVADLLLYKKPNQLNPDDYYQEAIVLVKDLLDSCEDAANFEDKMRDMFGIYAYIWFSMDKLITTLVKQLHTISCSDAYSRKLTALFKQCSKPFYGKDDQQNVLRIIHSGTGTTVKNRETRVGEVVADEYAYLEAATRLSLHHQEPLLLLMFHRKSPFITGGHLSVTLLDIPPEEEDEDDGDNEEYDDDAEEDDNDEENEDTGNVNCVGGGHGRVASGQGEEEDRDGDAESNGGDNEIHGRNRMLEKMSVSGNNTSCGRKRSKGDNDKLQHQFGIIHKSSNSWTSNCYQDLINLRKNLPHLIGWRLYVERYVSTNEKLGFSDGLTGLNLERRISVPVFLVRALRRNIAVLSSADYGNVNANDVSADASLLIDAAKTDDHSFMKNSETNESQVQNPADWHNVIVSLIINIFPDSNRTKLLQYLKRTVMTGQMSEEGRNLMAQYETNKISWSVGSNSIFHHVNSNRNVKERTKAVNDLRIKRFSVFHQKWLKKWQNKQS